MQYFLDKLGGGGVGGGQYVPQSVMYVSQYVPQSVMYVMYVMYCKVRL